MPNKKKAKRKTMNPDNKQPEDNPTKETNNAFNPGKPHASHNEQLRKARSRKQLLVRSLVLLAIVIAAGLGSLYYSNRSSQPTPTQPVLVDAEPVQAAVEVSGDGFSPATLAIPLNSTVTWTNTDSKSYSVQSDNIQGFVEPLALAKGETVSYSFDKPGTYTVTVPEVDKTMTIIVE